MGCARADHAHRRIDRVEAAQARLAHLVALLADELGIDLAPARCSSIASIVAAAISLTYEEAEAVGIDPDNGRAA